MIRRLAVVSALAALAALVEVWPAAAQPTPLFPGTTYERSVQFTPHGPVSIHVVRGPKPVGLYRLKPVLSNESIVQRETVSAMQKRLSTQATSVGVNGDYFAPADGRPTGIFLRDGVLATPPNAARSSAGVTLDGLLDVRRVTFRGTWRGAGQRRSLNFLNKAPGTNGISLFTADWGTTTPRVAGAFTAVLGSFPSATPNTDLVVPVLSAGPGSSVRIQPGTAVLVARGNAAAKLQAEAVPGTTVTLRLILQPDWAVVSDAIGGGPILVRDGAPVYRANEGFTTSQLAPRGPRTAVGQRADGGIILLTTDGRQPGLSVGMTNFELAQALVRYGAVRAMGLDGGGSSTLAFEGTVLNSPSDGRERAVSTALMLQYYGVYAAPPLEQVVSPNGDGVAETQELSVKVVRPSTTTTTLTAPDGTIAWQEVLDRQAGTYEVAFPPVPPPPAPPPEGVPPPPPPTPLPPAEGRWTLTVTALDDQGLTSTTTRRFWVNSTLASLRVAPARVVVRPTGGRAEIRWTQARAARVKVTIETPEGVVVRTVSNASLPAGEQTVTWDGRGGNRKPVGTGRYVARVTAANELGSVSLTQFVVVRRVAR
ncbi:MAG TPA: phosphodiester glycosidase family protein [Gaiellaceae bacterium]|nr:phosphodiester glycosidase family protein [Gaiellaceae bacterium]